MVDVTLEVIDLSTGAILGTFQLDLCIPKEYELDIGSYRLKATYLVTGEVLQADRIIAEGVNPSLEFTFAATPPPKHTLIVDSAPIQGIPVTIERLS